ncbi:TOM1-like protein 1 isoform X3 [Asparagus officinalis]|uniref:TOM1-like protein 1 isoform X3 n=1 Tax=Asparagus officinalis TaxID=4686 RepID=UPI00098E6AD5|nr:TOM1-like protein 1 isoform X3 [Asparagus officinalis]
MTGSMVDRATTDLLIGADWAMNLEICETLNRDPGLAKDVVKALKKRIRSRNPKVQILALTPDFNVKEKILVLIDTWQEAFGGPQARYPQYYAAYHELLRAGAVFPKKREGIAPIFTPGQKNSLPCHPRCTQNSDYQQEALTKSAVSNFPILSLKEIQNARVITDVLSEVLNTLDPGSNEEVRQEVIHDLAYQCRSYKERLIHLVSTSSDEDLLYQGLALNDELECVLAKHDALAVGIPDPVEKPWSLQPLVDIDDPVITNSDGNIEPDERLQSSASTSNQLPLEQLLSGVDLLSGDFDNPAAENALALVPVGEPLADSVTEQNALVLSDVFSQSVNNNGNDTPTSLSSYSETPSSQAYTSPQLTLYSNGSIPNSGAPNFQQLAYGGVPQNDANFAWNGQVTQGMTKRPIGVNDQGLPLPPWEAQQAESSDCGNPETQTMQNGLQAGAMHPQLLQNMHLGSPHPELVQSNQQPGIYPTYLSQSDISQRMYKLYVQDNSSYYTNTGSTYQISAPHVQQFNKLAKPEDKLFGDLVSMAKSKQSKTTASSDGNL